MNPLSNLVPSLKVTMAKKRSKEGAGSLAGHRWAGSSPYLLRRNSGLLGPRMQIFAAGRGNCFDMGANTAQTRRTYSRFFVGVAVRIQEGPGQHSGKTLTVWCCIGHWCIGHCFQVPATLISLVFIAVHWECLAYPNPACARKAMCSHWQSLCLGDVRHLGSAPPRDLQAIERLSAYD